MRKWLYYHIHTQLCLPFLTFPNLSQNSSRCFSQQISPKITLYRWLINRWQLLLSIFKLWITSCRRGALIFCKQKFSEISCGWSCFSRLGDEQTELSGSQLWPGLDPHDLTQLTVWSAVRSGSFHNPGSTCTLGLSCLCLDKQWGKITLIKGDFRQSCQIYILRPLGESRVNHS